MKAAHHPTQTGQGRLANSLLCVAAGLTAGILATTIGIDPPANGVPPASKSPATDPADPARFGSPGHITMSADAIEHWILCRPNAAARAGGCPDPADPARFGSPGHITMSADAIEHWILDPSRPSTPRP